MYEIPATHGAASGTAGRLQLSVSQEQGAGRCEQCWSQWTLYSAHRWGVYPRLGKTRKQK